MRRELKIKLLPNNQVSLFSQWVSRRDEERYSCAPDYSKEPEWEKEYHRSGRAKFERERMRTHEIQRIPFYKADGSISFRLLRVEKEKGAGAPPPAHYAHFIARLDIMKKSQRKARNLAGWGGKNTEKKFTHRAGQKIRECGAMMDKASGYEPSFCRVITLTLPGDTPEAFDALARYSGYAINRIFQPVRRMGLYDSHWFFVWEYQKRGALHLHIAISNPDKDKAKECGEKIIEKWVKVLTDIGKKSRTDMFVRRDRRTYTPPEKYQNLNQEMRKSCGGYFSKYAGKAEASKENSYVAKFSKLYPPSRFWGSSKSLKQMCKENSYEEILAIGESIEERHQEILELILRHNPVKFSGYEWRKEIIDSHGWEVVVSEGKCETFYLPKEFYFDLLAALKSEGQSLG